MSALAKLIPLNKVLGSLLVGSWINSMIFTIEIIQLWRYARYHRSKDSRLVQLSVAGAFLSDVVGTASIFWIVYGVSTNRAEGRNCITNWGNVIYLEDEPVGFQVFIVATSVSSFIVQCFLSFRACHLIPVHSIRVGVNSILIGMTLTGMSCTVWLLTTTVRYPSYLDRGRIILPALFAIVITFVTDITVTLVFLTCMYRLRQKYTANAINSRLGGVITKLSLSAIETGSVTVAWPQTFSFCIGRLYTCSMLFNLNARSKGDVPSLTTQSTLVTNSRSHDLKSARLTPLPIARVHVARELSVYFDEPTSSIQLGDIRDNSIDSEKRSSFRAL
ncbi:hypothetical protein RQP46_000991 [Phenoliferia psychrophenolica]